MFAFIAVKLLEVEGYAIPVLNGAELPLLLRKFAGARLAPSEVDGATVLPVLPS